MNFTLRMTRRFASKIVSDLGRPHEYAHERVGFLYCSTVRAGEDWIVFPTHFSPVPDDRYVDDPSVGATIDGSAIRAALQKALDTGLSCFHVHLHSRLFPGFGDLDLEEQEKLLPSFVATNGRVPHGALVLSEDGAEARAWLPRTSTPRFARRVAIVGTPLQLSRRAR